MDSGQKEEAQAEEGLIKEYPATSMAAVPSPVPDISPTERTSLSPLCRLVVFQGCPNANVSSYVKPVELWQRPVLCGAAPPAG